MLGGAEQDEVVDKTYNIFTSLVNNKHLTL